VTAIPQEIIVIGSRIFYPRGDSRHEEVAIYKKPDFSDP